MAFVFFHRWFLADFQRIVPAGLWLRSLPVCLIRLLSYAVYSTLGKLCQFDTGDSNADWKNLQSGAANLTALFVCRPKLCAIFSERRVFMDEARLAELA